MTYNPAIPGASDIISQSQAQIQTNFSQADTIFTINHGAFDAATVADRGKHRKVDFFKIAAPGAIANEAVLYAKAGPTSTEIFMQRDAVGTEIQLTSGNPIIASNGESFLPGLLGAPLRFKWGQFTTTGATTVVTYTALAPALTAFPTNTLMVQLTPINAGGVGNYRVSTANSTSFTVVAPTVSSFYFLAIGQ